MYATLPPVDIRLLDEQEHDDLPGRTHVINLAKGPPCPDPFALVKSELIPFSDNMKLLVASGEPHPVPSGVALLRETTRQALPTYHRHVTCPSFGECT